MRLFKVTVLTRLFLVFSLLLLLSLIFYPTQKTSIRKFTNTRVKGSSINQVPFYALINSTLLKYAAPIIKQSRVARNCFPRFLVIGAQKAGTSSMNAWLKTIGSIGASSSVGSFFSMPRYEKELNLLSERLFAWFVWKENEDNSENKLPGKWFVPWKPSGEDIMAWYKSQWEKAFDTNYDCINSQEVRGEVSPNYMSNPVSPFLARALFPDLKIIVMLRDPVDRIVSAFNMKWQVRVCKQGTAWSTSNCFRDLIRGNETTEYDLAKDWVTSLKNSVVKEISSIQKCLDTSVAYRSNFTLQQFTTSRLACAFPKDIFQTEAFPPDMAYSMYTSLEDEFFIRRSLYVAQLRLWAYFYSFNPANFLIVSAESFESNSTKILNDYVAPFLNVDLVSIRGQFPQEKFMIRHARSYILSDQLMDTNPDLRASYNEIVNTLRAFMKPWNVALNRLLKKHDFAVELLDGFQT